MPEITGSVRTGPIANAGNETVVDVGDTARIHALFSHDDDGDWLRFDWRIIVKPLDSSMELVDPGLATQLIVPDLEGQYLLGVTATDGVESTSTTVEISARTPSTNPRNGYDRIVVRLLAGYRVGGDGH